MAATPVPPPASTIPKPTRIPASSGTKRTFKEYIKDPRAKVPGTKMIFAGIKNEKDAENLWAYLKSFGPDGKKK